MSASGFTELATNGFQSYWSQNKFFRIDGNNSNVFIESWGKWLHNGYEILTSSNLNQAIVDLGNFVTYTYMAGYDSRATSEAKYMKISGGNTITGNQTITGDLTITGNITQMGASYITHAERVYTSNDFIVMRDGATGALGSGALSGLRISKADGNVNLVS